VYERRKRLGSTHLSLLFLSGCVLSFSRSLVYTDCHALAGCIVLWVPGVEGKSGVPAIASNQQDGVSLRVREKRVAGKSPWRWIWRAATQVKSLWPYDACIGARRVFEHHLQEETFSRAGLTGERAILSIIIVRPSHRYFDGPSYCLQR
jgi:hypothetical protein